PSPSVLRPQCPRTHREPETTDESLAYDNFHGIDSLVPPRAPASSTVRQCATRVQAWPGRHRVEAAWLALCLRPLAALGQEQESGGSGGEARRGRGLGQMTHPHSLPCERSGEK